MRSKWFVLPAALLVVFVLAALAADITGTWKAEITGRDGEKREMTMKFKSEGATLTGTVSGFQGAELQISDGKVSGSDVSFVVNMEFGGNAVKMVYEGKISGSEIQFKSHREGSERVREFTAKKM